MADFPEIVQVVPDPIEVLVEIVPEPQLIEVELGVPGPPGPPGTDAFDNDLALLYEIAKL